MIMDEPTNNLGVPEQQKVLELIRRLRDQGVPVILITHILPDVFAVTDRLIVMRRGRQSDREGDHQDERRGARTVHGRCRDDTRADGQMLTREVPKPA